MNKREHAESLRKQGFSYSMIQEKISVSQATLSQWLSSMPYTPSEAAIERARMGPIKSGEKRRKQKQKDILQSYRKAKEELGTISDRDLLMIGIGLYIGEGSKSLESVRIINSDPYVIKLGVRWLKLIGDVNSENLIIELHAYPDMDIEKSIRFWSKICGVGVENFAKTQVDRRQNKSPSFKRKLPHGTVQVRVKANGDKSKGVALFRKIQGYTQAVNETAL